MNGSLSGEWQRVEKKHCQVDERGWEVRWMKGVKKSGGWKGLRSQVDEKGWEETWEGKNMGSAEI